MASEVTAERGEEFRDDLRGTAASAVRSDAAQVRRLLSAETLADLTRLSPWRSTLAIATTLGTIALVLGVAWTHFTWWVVLPAVFLIGIQQHALFVLAHDSAHYRLYANAMAQRRDRTLRRNYRRRVDDELPGHPPAASQQPVRRSRSGHRITRRLPTRQDLPAEEARQGHLRLDRIENLRVLLRQSRDQREHAAGATSTRRHIGRASHRGAARPLGRGRLSYRRTDHCAGLGRTARARSSIWSCGRFRSRP